MANGTFQQALNETAEAITRSVLTPRWTPAIDPKLGAPVGSRWRYRDEKHFLRDHVWIITGEGVPFQTATSKCTCPPHTSLILVPAVDAIDYEFLDEVPDRIACTPAQREMANRLVWACRARGVKCSIGARDLEPRDGSISVGGPVWGVILAPDGELNEDFDDTVAWLCDQSAADLTLPGPFYACDQRRRPEPAYDPCRETIDRVTVTAIRDAEHRLSLACRARGINVAHSRTNVGTKDGRAGFWVTVDRKGDRCENLFIEDADAALDLAFPRKVATTSPRGPCPQCGLSACMHPGEVKAPAPPRREPVEHKALTSVIARGGLGRPE